MRLTLSRKEREIKPEFNFEKYRNDFTAAMDDDFNSPQACAVIFDFIRDVNRTISENEKINSEFISFKCKRIFSERLQKVFWELLICQSKVACQIILWKIELIELLIGLRADAKKEKNYALSDKIRNGLNRAWDCYTGFER